MLFAAIAHILAALYMLMQQRAVVAGTLQRSFGQQHADLAGFRQAV
jgi:hypothetical protein